MYFIVAAIIQTIQGIKKCIDKLNGYNVFFLN